MPPRDQQAQAAYDAGRLDEAAALYRQTAANDPGTVHPWSRLGVIYARQGRLEAAEWALRQALRHGDDPRVRHNLGLVRLRLAVRDLLAARRNLPPDAPQIQQSRALLRELLERAL